MSWEFFLEKVKKGIDFYIPVCYNEYNEREQQRREKQ